MNRGRVNSSATWVLLHNECYMYDSTIKLKLQEQWDWIGEDWREILARNLDLIGCFSQKDLDYILTLEELDCYEGNFENLTPLYLMPQLRRLELRDLEIKDYSPLSALHDLEVLSAVFCSLSDTRVLSGLQNLEVLDLSYPISDSIDLTGVKNLSELRELYCNACQGLSLYDLIHLPNLEVLSLYFSPVKEEELQMFQQVHPHCHILH